MQIGTYKLRSDLVLAPMAGVSQMPFRRIALELGAGLAPTELVSAEGLLRASARTLRYLRHDARVERPFSVQIFGSDPVKMAEAARVARDHGAEILDINMGCPVPKVTRSGAGAALLCEPDRAAALVAAVREAAGIPVTVKIRSGWDASRVNAAEVARVLERAGAAAIAVHPRTRVQGYGGRADWAVIARVKEAVKVPVIGNGDVLGRADAERMRRETGCDAVMVGRAALGNPWIFRELLGGPRATSKERLALVLRHFDEHLALGGDPAGGVRSFRRMLLWYAHGLRGAAQFRRVAAVLVEEVAVRDAIRGFFAEAVPDTDAQPPQEFDERAAYG